MPLLKTQDPLAASAHREFITSDPKHESIKRRHVYFAFFMLSTVAVFFSPLSALVKLSFENPAYSHVVLIPVISGFLIFLRRRLIFARVEYCLSAGTITIVAGAGGLLAAREHMFLPGGIDPLPLVALSLIFVWTGGFIACYGLRALKQAAFPALFLGLMIPLPDVLLDKLVFALQKGSTEITYGLFKAVGVPVLKQGFVFSLPGFNVEVAQECSGIRSFLALFITSLLAGHFFLQSGWRKLILCLVTVPIAIAKNAIRIATISLLSVYVNQGFLTGNLHRRGGLPFSLIAVAVLVPILWWLQRPEVRSRARAQDATPGTFGLPRKTPEMQSNAP